MVGLQSECPIETLHRALVLTATGQQHGPIVVRGREVRVKPDGALETLQGFLHTPDCLECNPEISVRARIFESQAHSVSGACECFLAAPEGAAYRGTGAISRGK